MKTSALWNWVGTATFCVGFFLWALSGPEELAFFIMFESAFPLSVGYILQVKERSSSTPSS